MMRATVIYAQRLSDYKLQIIIFLDWGNRNRFPGVIQLYRKDLADCFRCLVCHLQKVVLVLEYLWLQMLYCPTLALVWKKAGW